MQTFNLNTAPSRSSIRFQLQPARMEFWVFLWVVALSSSMLLAVSPAPSGSCSLRDAEANMYFEKLNNLLKEKKRSETLAKYNYNINVTEENRLKMIDVATSNSKFIKEKAEAVLDLGYQYLEDAVVKKLVKSLTKLRYNALSEEDYNALLNAVSRMQTNYAKVRVCSFADKDKCDLALEPEIQERIQNSRDPEELKYYWKEWYDKAGAPAKEDFKKYIELGRKSAKLNDFKSLADDWVDEYDDPNFEENLDKTYNQILPFYKQLHGYVRYHLRQKFGDSVVSENGNIPMHLLGNLWGQQWHAIMDLITPYPEKPFFDVTSEMVKQQYTPIKLFQMGDEFFQSLNMTKLPETFWKESVLTKPSDGRDIICHASAWDMYAKDDVRIKQCTDVTMEHLYIAHHELGHIQYYLQYQDQPALLHDAPNPGFHEAVGDVIALSVATPKHLAKIGLVKETTLDEKSRINELFKNAMKKIVFLPFAYTMDKYRYAVFRQELPEDQWNCGFWKMRSNQGGLEPAVARSEEDFDPPAKYHIDADVEYLRYFAAHIFQFQFHKALCEKAGQYKKGDPNLTLDNCDIHGSAEAGNAFKAFLSHGSSKPWKDILEDLTGEREMSAAALLEYFEPLRIWLEEENKKLNVPIGWSETEKCK